MIVGDSPVMPEILTLEGDQCSLNDWARRSDIKNDDEAESNSPRASTDNPSGDSTRTRQVMRRMPLPVLDTVCEVTGSTAGECELSELAATVLDSVCNSEW